MPSTMIDSAVFRDLFSTAAMRRVFSDETRIQGYLDIETALARVEAFEAFAPGRGASSTMPQKRNPGACNYILACASIVRQQVAALLEAMVEDHERATGSWQIEWVAIPEIFLLTSGALAHARALVRGLPIDAARMRDACAPAQSFELPGPRRYHGRSGSRQYRAPMTPSTCAGASCALPQSL